MIVMSVGRKRGIDVIMKGRNLWSKMKIVKLDEINLIVMMIVMLKVMIVFEMLILILIVVSETVISNAMISTLMTAAMFGVETLFAMIPVKMPTAMFLILQKSSTPKEMNLIVMSTETILTFVL